MKETGRANTVKSYMIALAGGGTNPVKPKVMLYRYSPSKSAQSLEMILKDYQAQFKAMRTRVIQALLSKKSKSMQAVGHTHGESFMIRGQHQRKRLQA